MYFLLFYTEWIELKIETEWSSYAAQHTQIERWSYQKFIWLVLIILGLINKTNLKSDFGVLSDVMNSAVDT